MAYRVSYGGGGGVAGRDMGQTGEGQGDQTFYLSSRKTACFYPIYEIWATLEHIFYLGKPHFYLKIKMFVSFTK